MQKLRNKTHKTQKNKKYNNTKNYTKQTKYGTIIHKTPK